MKHPFVFMDVSINDEPAGRIIIELISSVVPITAENFRALCVGHEGLSYANTLFHRITPGFCIVGGDVTHSQGAGNVSIYGGEFEDENCALKHQRSYLLSMVNRGRDSNGSQFFITLGELPHLDDNHVAFGRVVKGFEVVDRMAECGSDDGTPLALCAVTACGELDKEKLFADAAKRRAEAAAAKANAAEGSKPSMQPAET